MRAEEELLRIYLRFIAPHIPENDHYVWTMLYREAFLKPYENEYIAATKLIEYQQSAAYERHSLIRRIQRVNSIARRYNIEYKKGKWKIVEMEQWDQDYVDLVGV